MTGQDSFASCIRNVNSPETCSLDLLILTFSDDVNASHHNYHFVISIISEEALRFPSLCTKTVTRQGFWQGAWVLLLGR